MPALEAVWGYCDTADQGTDYLCSIIFGKLASTGDVAILDVIYTQEPMEVTVWPLVADTPLSTTV